MPISNDQIVENIREYRKKSGKTQLDLANILGKTTASISDLERGRVQVSASELSQIADFLNIPINSFYDLESEDDDIEAVISSIKEQPKESRIDTIGLLKLYIDLQMTHLKIMANPKKDLQPEELGEIVTKLLNYREKYNAMTMKLDSAINGLIEVLNDHGITLPKQ